MAAKQSISDRWQALVQKALEEYSATQLAALLGVDRSAVARYAKYGALPDVEKLQHYCRLLGTDLSELSADTWNEHDIPVMNQDNLLSQLLKLPRSEQKRLLVEMVKAL